MNYVFEDGKYLFKKVNIVHAKVEREFKRRNYSKFGVGSEETTKFTIRYKRGLDITNSIKFGDIQYLISSVEDIENRHRYQEVVAVDNKPRLFTLKRYVLGKDITFNRPIKELKTIYDFEGYITEKYTGYSDEKINTISIQNYILIVPKVIDLYIGDILVIGDEDYNIQDTHKIDDYINEYEIVLKKDN